MYFREKNVIKYLGYIKDYVLIKKSGLFDANYYDFNYPDVKRAGINPLFHFIRFGWKEGRNPSINFNTNLYLSCNKQVYEAGINPLVHYIRFNIQGKRKIDLAQYKWIKSYEAPQCKKSYNKNIKGSNIKNYDKNFTPEENLLINLLKKFDYFDSEWYLFHNKDVQILGIDPWVHFVRYGLKENRRPNPFFDPVWYLNQYKDVREAGYNPLLHYLKHGVNEYRKAYNTESISILAVEHCTNTCQHCSTSSPFAGKKSHPASAFYPWLDMLEKSLIPFKYIAVTGGEPFLHHDLGALVNDLRMRYPLKKIGITTNFFWASEKMIRLYAPIIRQLNAGLFLSIYPNLINKLGSIERVNELVNLVKELCPEVNVKAWHQSMFRPWRLHMEKHEVKDICVTSDCYILRADGNISHCSIGVGLEYRPEYLPIVNLSKERLFDLKNGIEGFKLWSLKYPFDLCFHCTMWRNVTVPWSDNLKKI